jgi:hypothetical protein
MISEPSGGSILGTLLNGVCSRNIPQKIRFKLQSWARRARDAATLLGSRRFAFVSNRRGQCNTPVARQRQRARAGDIAAVHPLP